MDTDKYTTWHLSNMAGCGSPDRSDGIGFASERARDAEPASAGAQYLRRVAEAFAEALEYSGARGDDARDEAAEVVDSCVPIYTHDLWTTFVDLAAYQEDVSEYAGEEHDMEQLARVALYLIGERLAYALLEDAEGEA